MKTKYQVQHGTVRVSDHTARPAAIKAAREYLAQQRTDRFIPVSVVQLKGLPVVVWSNR